MNEITAINNVRGYLDENGTAQLNLEDVSRGLGFVQTKNNVEYIRWETVFGYLQEIGFSQPVGKEDFIPENIFYKLCFKANNETARKFQDKVTDEILPSIRKHGAYMTPEKIEEVLLNPDTIIKLATALKNEQTKNNQLQETLKEQQPLYILGKAVSASDSSILLGNFAKIMKQNGLNIGQNRFFEWLREKDYLCKDGRRYNCPTQKSMNLGIMEFETSVITTSGRTQTKYTPKLTSKGQVYFTRIFEKKMLPREMPQYNLLSN